MTLPRHIETILLLLSCALFAQPWSEGPCVALFLANQEVNK